MALNGTVVQTNRLGCLAAGADVIELRAGHDSPARVLLLGGVPLGEQIVMWWNFISRSHDEIVRYRADWQALITAAPGPRGGGRTGPRTVRARGGRPAAAHPRAAHAHRHAPAPRMTEFRNARPPESRS